MESTNKIADLQKRIGMSEFATGSLPSEQFAEKRAEILEVPSSIVPADEERSYATEKKWSVSQSILFVFVTSAVLWALVIIGARQIF